jgi:hypothetical protein
MADRRVVFDEQHLRLHHSRLGARRRDPSVVRVYRAFTEREAVASHAARTLAAFACRAFYSPPQGADQMRRATTLGVTAAVLVLVVAACGSSGAKQATTPSTATPGSSSSSVSPASRAVTKTPEVSPSGDIPDNQAFVKYTSRTGAYSLDFPEGWARTESVGTTTFSARFNSIRIATTKRASAPTIASVRATEVPALQRATAGFTLRNVTSVNRPAGSAVLVTYGADSPPDAVTGKTIALDVERYKFWHNGTQVTITLSAPKGSDNVDPWKKVTDSFAWSA